MKAKRRPFRVVFGKFDHRVMARTAGAAARIAFRIAIATKYLKRQPVSLPDGGWRGVSISAV